ncbi:hypothetical protein PC116_g21969 [Phytophthora cactorum]|nr:hypothetical protein PC116_g21969 [Phytophthora cactorum]
MQHRTAYSTAMSTSRYKAELVKFMSFKGEEVRRRA